MNDKKINDFIKKVNDSKKDNKLDLSTEEDLSIALMNLISIEEHFFFTAEKTEKTSYFDLLNEIRAIRKELMLKIIKDYEGEVWCISKHLLASSMRLMEVGTKLLGKGQKKEAYEMFDKSYNLYTLFWGLVLKVVKTENINKIDENQISKTDSDKKNPIFSKLKSIVKKTIDCCIE